MHAMLHTLRSRVSKEWPERQPLVSVITVVRNMRKTIEQSVVSVLDQSYRAIEYIVIDGHSTDGTSEILAPYVSKISKYIREEDESLYHAMNKGLHIAKGDFVLFLNADDYYRQETVEKLVEQWIASGADIVSAQSNETDSNGSALKRSAYMQYNSTVLLGMPFRHELMLIPKDIYLRIGYYNSTYQILADWEFSKRLWRAGVRASQMRSPLMFMRNTGVSITDFSKRVEESRMLMRDEFPFLDAETCTRISDPRAWNKNLCLELLEKYSENYHFSLLVKDYGFRRQLITSADLKLAPVTDDYKALSIVIPVYNAESTLERALNSALADSDENVEIICVDDCSTDDSINILSKLGQDKRVQIIVNNYNVGVSRSRNIGLHSAQGKYVFFLDADDELNIEEIMQGLAKAEEHNSDAMIMAYEIVGKSGVTIRSKVPNGETLINKRFSEISSYFMTPDYPKANGPRTAGEGFWSCLYRTEQARNILFREDLSYGEDSLFFLSFMSQAKRITWIDQLSYRYHVNPGSAMTRISAKRLLNTIQWRVWASTILINNEAEELAKFICTKYWPANLSALMRKIQFTHQEKREINNLIQIISSNYGDVLDCCTDDVKTKQFDKCNITPSKVNTKTVIADQRSDAPDVMQTGQLKVNIFMSTDRGGAAQGSIRRMNALRNIGIDARIITALKSCDVDYVFEMIGSANKRKKFVSSIIDKIWKQNYCTSTELFSNLGSIVSYQDNREYFTSPDVLHFHWMTGVLDETQWHLIKGKPVCWTLADMNPFTGGCHYSEGCTGYISACENCNLLTSNKNIAAEQWGRKKSLYDQIEQLTIICPSQWMAKRVKESSLLGKREVVVIPNAMPVKKFIPHNQLVARIKLGLPSEALIILFGADDNRNKRKGGDIISGALHLLAGHKLHDQIHLLTFGHYQLDSPFPSTNVGYIEDEEKLSLVYSAADCYCLPSREDNAPLTVAEAMLCGTPVVSTPVGNVPELISHKETGFITKGWSESEMLDGLVFVLSHLQKRTNTSLQSQIRSAAYQQHEPSQAAERHYSVYKKIIKSRIPILD